MTFQETSDIGLNIKRNNNIAMKNIDIVKPSVGGSISGTIYTGNWSDIIRAFCLKFVAEECSISLHQEAEITVKLSDAVYAAWVRGGMQCVNMEYKGDQVFWIKSADAHLCNLIFYPEELGALSVQFNFLTKEITDQTDYKFHVIQTDAATDEIIGGELYHVITSDRTPFFAEAEDVYAFQNDPITLSAEDIGEDAVYNWYDMEGNLVCEEIKFETVANHEIKYKLEVIALSDGYKDYAEVAVKIVPGKIEELYPNPTNDMLTVTCVFNDATVAVDASIIITDYFGTVYMEQNLITSPQTVKFDVNNYPTGAYMVKLICNGQLADMKTFVKQ
jgi:hypothetical protein